MKIKIEVCDKIRSVDLSDVCYGTYRNKKGFNKQTQFCLIRIPIKHKAWVGMNWDYTKNYYKEITAVCAVRTGDLMKNEVGAVLPLYAYYNDDGYRNVEITGLTYKIVEKDKSKNNEIDLPVLII